MAEQAEVPVDRYADSVARHEIDPDSAHQASAAASAPPDAPEAVEASVEAW